MFKHTHTIHVWIMKLWYIYQRISHEDLTIHVGNIYQAPMDPFSPP